MHAGMSACQSFSLWLLQVFVISGLLVFFLWLSLRPSSPSYAVVDFSVPTNASAGRDTAISFGLEASNDNMGGRVYYDDIVVTMYFENNGIGAATLPPFSQGHERTTGLAGGVAVEEGLLGEVARAVRKGTARLKVGLAATVRYRVWKWRSRGHYMLMEAAVEVGRDGKMSSSLSSSMKKKISMHTRKRWRKVL